ncbi:hypothetical protein [uncultured Croceitalea sp.]|uniref:hypothetical protein n=1 Tax=uncultured Croceitalea sp. TaxID=1798908 RepID=UPI00374F5DB2
MSKKLLFLFALMGSITLFSCTAESLTEDKSLYETQSTEGDDGDEDKDPDK